jgi:hypothetical protein
MYDEKSLPYLKSFVSAILARISPCLLQMDNHYGENGLLRIGHSESQREMQLQSVLQARRYFLRYDTRTGAVRIAAIRTGSSSLFAQGGGRCSKYGNILRLLSTLSFNDVIISTFPNKLGEKILTSTSLSKMCQITAVCYSVSLQIFEIEVCLNYTGKRRISRPLDLRGQCYGTI